MSEKKEDPFDGIEEEMVFDMDEEESDPALTETADFGAVLPSDEVAEPAPAQAEAVGEEAAAEEAPEAEAAAEEPAPEAEAAAEEPAAEEVPEAEAAAEPAAEEAAVEGESAGEGTEDEEDTRWRFRSRSGLVLFFPTYEVATKWIIKQNPADISIAHGSGEFRSYTDFEAQLKITGDPMAAILAEAAEIVETQGDESAGEAAPEASEAPQSAAETSEAAAADPVAEVSPPSGEPTESEPSSRTTTMTSEFQFRTGKDVNVWPGRILFLVIGLLLGGGGVYYAAWYGLLPGILY